MNYNTKLNIVKYTAIVEAIADGYFDFDGTYQPHIGMMNAMRVFYNECVTESIFDEKYPHNITNILDMQDIVNDDDFIKVFNSCLKSEDISFDFGNAYFDAMKIVDNRKGSLANMFEQIKNMITGFSAELEHILTPDNLKAVKEVAVALGNGSALDDALAKARIQKAVE